MFYAILNNDVNNKIILRHSDKDYLNTPRISLYLDAKAENLNASIEYLAALKNTNISSVTLYNDNIMIMENNFTEAHLLELSDRLENLPIDNNIERNIRAVITYQN